MPASGAPVVRGAWPGLAANQRREANRCPTARAPQPSKALLNRSESKQPASCRRALCQHCHCQRACLSRRLSSGSPLRSSSAGLPVCVVSSRVSYEDHTIAYRIDADFRPTVHVLRSNKVSIYSMYCVTARQAPAGNMTEQ